MSAQETPQWNGRRATGIAILLFLLLASSAVFSQPGQRSAAKDISASFQVLYAPWDKFQVEDFYADVPPAGFLPLNPPTNINRVDGEAWLRTVLPASSTDSTSNILHIPGQIFNYVDVWFRLKDGRIYHHYAGDRYPFVERSIRTAAIAFPIPAGNADPIDVLIRARNMTAQPMNFAALVWPAEGWQSYLLRLGAWYGAFLGAIFILCLYNVFLALSLRDSSYLLYICYILNLTLGVILLSGLAEEFFWPGGKPASFVLATTGVGAFFAVAFVNHFLKIKEWSPGAYWTSTVLATLAMLMGLVLTIYPNLPFMPPAYSAITVHVLALLVGSIYFIGVALLRYSSGIVHARFLALSMLSLLVCMVFYFAYTYGYVQYNPFIGHALEFGALAEGVLLALALADRINFLIQQKQAAEREALEYQQTFSQNLINAQEKERETLSQTMHDSIGHAVLVLKNNLHQCLGLLPAEKENNPSEVSMLLREQLSFCGEIMHDVRRISHDLHPHMLQHLGLAAALRSTMERALAHAEIRWSLDVDELAEDLDPDVKITVYRVVQECLSNIIKYASADNVFCAITCSDGVVRGTVSDDGIGFKTQHKETATLGLQGMRDRVQLVGGTMGITSTQKRGTRVSFELPAKLVRPPV
ncbi:MAG: hypothetical protein IMF06_05560 [Proteobacteria bacterium]|nr:hypothetical protein [Pseudomonadota bacterium]